MTKPVTIAISSCLVGEPVRYDGQHKRQDWLSDCGDVIWIPVCPEVELGMTVPREPIQIERCGMELKLLAVDSRTDWTEEMAVFTASRIRQLKEEQISGYVFKARSPSCGTGEVPVWEFGTHNVVGHTQGLFTGSLQTAWSELPIINEDRMQRLHERHQFLQRVHQYAYQQTMKEDQRETNINPS